MPLFRSREEGQLPRGDSILGELQQLDRQIRQLDQDHYAPALSPALCLLENKVLRHLDQDCTKVMAVRSWLSNINPRHLLRRKRLRNFLQGQGESHVIEALPTLQAAIHLESQWRPLRAELSTLHHALELEAVSKQACLELISFVKNDIRHLLEIQALALALAQSPRARQADE
ncbi:hypothetical protein A259_37566, partial [Pseudomonas syringae pv. actinidiae ICMP 19070]